MFFHGESQNFPQTHLLSLLLIPLLEMVQCLYMQCSSRLPCVQSDLGFYCYLTIFWVCLQHNLYKFYKMHEHVT